MAQEIKRNMRIIHLSDTHNKHNQVEKTECDLIAHTGDFSSIGSKEQVLAFLKWFSRYPSTYKIFIAGNHDISFDANKFKDKQKPEWLQEALSDFQKYDALNFYLENSGCEIEGLKFWGSPVTPRFGHPRWAFNEDRGWNIRQVWNEIPDDTDVLLTHGPPAGILDYVPFKEKYEEGCTHYLPGGNRGCVDLRDRVLWIEPRYHLFGHIHEEYGYRDRGSGSTTYLNGSLVDMHYNLVNEPHKIQYERIL